MMRLSARSFVGVAVMLTCMGMTTTARAEPTASDKAMADALFREAKALAAQNRFGEACPKIAEAQRLDPAPGAGLVLGDCYERVGKLASAWGAFNETIAIARNARDEERRVEAARRAGLLEGRVPKVTIVVPPPVRVPGLEIRWDGKAIGDAAWGSAIPADPGAHMIEAVAPGRKTWSTQITVPGSGVMNITVPMLDEAPSGATAAPVTFWGPQRIGGLVTGVVGLVGFGIGGAFAAQAASKNKDSLPHCLPDNIKLCDATGVALREEAFANAGISTGMFIGGGIVTAVGIVVFATAPNPKATMGKNPSSKVAFIPVAGPGIAGFNVQGAW